MSAEIYTRTASEAKGMFGWYRELSPPGRKSFWAAYCGWCLDAADAQVFNFLIPTLMATWALTGTQIGAISSTTWISASIGGWLGGILADRFGRVRALQITILCFSVGTLLCGLAQSYEQLLIARAIFGFGFGGEWAIGSVLVSEFASDKRRGTVGGVVQTAFTVGWMLASLLYPIYYALLPEHLAWRGLMMTGALPALFIFFIRRYVSEPPIYAAQKQSEQKRSSFLEIFARERVRVTATLALLGVGIHGGTFAFSIWLPTYLKTVRHFSPTEISSYMMVFLASTLLGYILGAVLADTIGRRLSIILCVVAECAMVAIYTTAPVGNSLLLFLGIPLGICFASVYGGVSAILAEAFPTRLRGSGVGFCWNFGRGAGALFGLFVGMYSAQLGLGVSIATFVAAAFSLALIAALLLPETKGTQLT